MEHSARIMGESLDCMYFHHTLKALFVNKLIIIIPLYVIMMLCCCFYARHRKGKQMICLIFRRSQLVN